MRQVWRLLGKRDDLLKAEAASPSSSESEEEQSESHSLPKCASPFAFVGSMLRRRRSSRKKRLSAEAACERGPKLPLHEASVLQTNLKIE
jgi:hypothetical protein